MKSLVFALWACVAACAWNCPGAGVLFLRFDDRNFAGWQRALPLFEKYDARVNFFVNGAMDAETVGVLKRLQACGHSVGLHGVEHLQATDALAKCGEADYFAREIEPQLAVARAAGLEVRAFAYPYSARNEKTDALLCRHFDRLVSGGYWKQSESGRIAACDELFVPCERITTTRLFTGASLGSCSPSVTGELAKVIHRLACRNEAALFNSHNIVEGPDRTKNDITFAELEVVLKAAKDAGVLVTTLDSRDYPYARDYDFSRQRLFPGYDGKYCKMQPCVATDWRGTALLTYQRILLSGSDVFCGQYISKSVDGGRTWSEPRLLDFSRDLYEGDVRIARYASVRYSRRNSRWYAIGMSQAYAGNSRPLDERHHGRPCGVPLYVEVDVGKGDFGAVSEMPLPLEYDVAMPFGEPVDLDNGNILVPYHITRTQDKLKPGAWSRPCVVLTVEYRFAAKGLELVRAGEAVECPELQRGLVEPSLVRWNGRYYLTVRSDERGMFAESADGFRFGALKTWSWEDGTPIGNRNTQQHWMVGRDALYLAYTRETGANRHVFRNRAPVYFAKFDAARGCLLRDTEFPLVPELGARLGNFQTISDGGSESWLVTAEWMQPLGCARYGADNALWLVKTFFARR